ADPVEVARKARQRAVVRRELDGDRNRDGALHGRRELSRSSSQSTEVEASPFRETDKPIAGSREACYRVGMRSSSTIWRQGRRISYRSAFPALLRSRLAWLFYLGVAVLIAACSDAGPSTTSPAEIAYAPIGPISDPSGRGSFRFGAASAATQIEDQN